LEARRVQCANAARQRGCDHKRSYGLRDIEREAVQHVANVFADPDTVKQMAEEFEKRAGANQRAANNELPKIVKRLEEIEAGTLRLVTALERGSMPEGIIAERLQALEAERVALAEKRRIAESKVVKLAILPSALRKWHADLQFLSAKLQEGEAPVEVRAALRNLLDSILIHPVPKLQPLKIEPLVHRAALAGVPLFPQQRRPEEIAGQFGQVFQLNGGPLKFSHSFVSHFRA
jgi:hypothetical protein